MSIYNITPQVANALIDAFDPQRGFVTWSKLETRIMEFRSAMAATAKRVTVSIAAGEITFQRTERFMYLSVDTEGSGPSDTLSTITAEDVSDYDIIYIDQAGDGRIVYVDGGGNIQTFTGESITIDRLRAHVTSPEHKSWLALMWYNGSWHCVGSHPFTYARAQVDSTLGFTQEVLRISSGALTATSTNLSVEGEYAGEVAAAFQIEITSAGSAGSFVQVWVDTGTDKYSIGNYAVILGDAIANVVAGLVTSITSSGWGATNASPFINGSAPAGIGALANFWTISMTVAGDTTGTITTPLGGGVDGVPAADTLSHIHGPVGTLIFLRNAMASAAITLDKTGNILLPSPSTSHILAAGEVLGLIINADSRAVVLSMPVTAQVNLYGFGRPASSLGKPLDLYLETSNDILWEKSALGVWSKKMKGASWEHEVVASWSGSVAQLATKNATATVVASSVSWQDDITTTYFRMNTTAVIGNGVTLIMQRWARIDHHPDVLFHFRMPNTLTNIRFYAGICTNSFTDTNTPAGEYLAISYNSADGEGKFQFRIKGTAAEVKIDTGVTPVSNRVYCFILRKDINNTVSLTYVSKHLSPPNDDLTLVLSSTTATFTAGGIMQGMIALWTRAAVAQTIDVHKIAGKATI